MKPALFFLLLPLQLGLALVANNWKSHHPLRPQFTETFHTIAKGPKFYVSPDGSDEADGSKEKPFKTIQFALTRLKAGDTLYLREGIYRENVRMALRGTMEKPITLSGYPEEHAVIDGSIGEFFDDTTNAWELVNDELQLYQSTKLYPNLRNVLGSFGDSLIGLQTYYHKKDLEAENQLLDYEDWDRPKETDLKPVYLGPGLWYDSSDGRIHLRLSHTRSSGYNKDYTGETDPRKLPMILAPYHSLPLTLSGAQHVRIRDLSIRGAGYTALHMEQSSHLELSNVTIWAGTYGIRASGVQHLRLMDCGVYGNVAPWTYRSDSSKRDYPGRPHRNLSRLNTHASIEIDSGRESSVHAFPQNDHWEIGYCEFTDAHDGPYLGAIHVHFHNNLVENMQDDGIYLSPMYKRHRLEDKDPVIRIEQNQFRQVLTSIAFGGPWQETRDQIYIYRNVFDLRLPVYTGRSSTRKSSSTSSGKLMGDHGSPPWPSMNIYHNTVITGDNQRYASGGSFSGLQSGNPRRVYNNLFFHFGRFPGFPIPKPEDDFLSDGNLYWSKSPNLPYPDKYFGKFWKARPESEKHSVIGDPWFRDLLTRLDYRLSKNSAAINAGVALPNDWFDSEVKDPDKPDIGAIPFDNDFYIIGRRPRNSFWR
jgi:hypothetical protein